MTEKMSEFLAKKEQYLLKATFVKRKLRADGYYSLLNEIDSIVTAQGDLLDWSKRQSWGISEEAWEIIARSKISPLKMFCHPKILNQHPTTLLYHRSVSLLPQKGFQTLVRVNPCPFEKGDKEPGTISKEIVNRIVVGVNEIVSNTLSQGSMVTIEEITGNFFAQAGITIDGSWRNQIGVEGQLVIWVLIAKALSKNGEILSVSEAGCHGDTLIEELNPVDLENNWIGYRALNLANGSSVAYASEPDIILYNSSGELVGAIEIKSGLDPAGALERTGAVLKSFESILGEYPNAKTMLVTSCETAESRRRLNESRAVHFTYITAELTTNESLQRKFINQIRDSLGLIGE